MPPPPAIRVVTHSADARPAFSIAGEPAGGVAKREPAAYGAPSAYGGGRDSAYSAQHRDSASEAAQSPYRAAREQPLSAARRDSCRAAGVPSAGARSVGVSCGFAADQNARFRNYMEDEHCVAKLDELREGAMWFGLFDGHGGRTACELAKAQLHKTFVSEALSGGFATRAQVRIGGL